MPITSRFFAAALVLVAACSHAAITPPAIDAPARAPAPSVALASHRAQMLDWLQEYATAGVYPTDASGWPLSVFRDSHGVRCPMAELIYRSGRADLVELVATTDNALRLADVHDGPLLAWMDDSGLTRDEIVMIQGAANIPMPDHLMEMTQLAEAHGRVHGRLDTATVAIRNATPRKHVAKSATPIVAKK